MKVYAGEECLSQHWLLVGNIVMKRTVKKRKKNTILKVWRLKEEDIK